MHFRALILPVLLLFVLIGLSIHFMSASSYASIFDPATGGLHNQLNQAELLTQQQNLWTILSVGLFALGVLGILIIYSSLFIQERMRATRFFNRALLLIAISSAACLLIDTTLNLPDVTAQLILWQSEVEFRPQGDIHAAAIHAAMAAMIAVVAYLPLSHQLTLRATIILALSIGSAIYPAYLKGVQGLLLHPISQNTVLSVGFEQIGGGTVVTLLATFVAFSGMFVTGLRNSPALPEYILRNTQNYNVLRIKAGAALMAVGGIGFSVGNTSIYSGELGSAIFNVLVATGVSVTLGVALGFFAPRKVMYPTILLSMIGGLSSVLGNAQHLTVAGVALIALTASVASIAVARIIYARSKTHKVIIYYTSLGIGSLIGLFGFTTALPADHALAGFSLDNFILQAVGALLTIFWAFLSGLLLFTSFKFTKQFRKADEIDLNETPIVSTISQMENLIGKLVWHDAKLDERLPVRDNDPQERLASLFNTFLDKLQSDEKRRKISETSNSKQQEELSKLATFAEGAFEGLAISTDGIIVECNHVLYELLDYQAGEMRGTSLLSHVAPDYREKARESILANEPTPNEVMLLSKSGERIPIEVRGRLMEVADENLRVSAVRDMRKQKEDEARILHLAQHDMLTGLPNRTYFRERFQKAIENQANAEESISAVMLLDLDRFKDINDLYGHPIGDKLIQTVARRLNACVTHHDTVARLGGDEFAIIQVNLKTTAEVGLLTNKILEVLSKPIHVGNNITVRTSASIGIALIPDHGTDPDELMSKADIALYEAKEAGRNTFAFFEDKMEEAILLRRTMEGDLRNALENEELQLHFQPQARSDTRSIVGFEALLRWNHPEKGQIGPNNFIPVAEESGLIIPIGRWVLNEACAQASQWPERYRVGVNLSPVQFCDEYLIQEVEGALARSGLSPERLELEITESVLIHDDRRALNTLRQLKELGITIALDDFGTGYSSLSYLRRFPFDRLKIDRSFVSGVTQTPELAAIIRAVIDLGQALGMEVIAEGVETEPELELLRNESCDEVQGFLIGRPQVLDSEMAKHVSNANLEIQALDQYIAALQETSLKLKEKEKQAADKALGMIDAGD